MNIIDVTVGDDLRMTCTLQNGSSFSTSHLVFRFVCNNGSAKIVKNCSFDFEDKYVRTINSSTVLLEYPNARVSMSKQYIKCSGVMNLMISDAMIHVYGKL